jgi:hypothetical protein
MQNSPTALCNLALGIAGIAPVVNMIEPKTTIERILNSVYDTARQNLYNDFYFQFSMRTATLGAEVIDDVEQNYSTRFPKDFIRLCGVYDGNRLIKSDGKHYRVYDNRIYGITISPPYVVRYVKDEEDVSLMTPDFKLLFALNILRIGGVSLDIKEREFSKIMNLYEVEALKARNNNAIDNPPSIINDSEYVDVYERHDAF